MAITAPNRPAMMMLWMRLAMMLALLGLAVAGCSDYING